MPGDMGLFPPRPGNVGRPPPCSPQTINFGPDVQDAKRPRFRRVATPVYRISPWLSNDGGHLTAIGLSRGEQHPPQSPPSLASQAANRAWAPIATHDEGSTCELVR